MIASILIIVFSVALLVYWFRYSCILLLRNQSETAFSAAAIEDHRFRLQEVRDRLNAETELDPLHAAIRRDYEVLSYLFQHAAGLEPSSIEDRLLILDYKVMQGWYSVTRIAAPDQAREALREMALVLGILAGKIAERATANGEA